MNFDSRNDAKFYRQDVMARSKGRCELCGDDHPWTLEHHHIVPVHRGGDGFPDNLIALCPNCHAIIEKLRSESVIEDPHFHDWIRRKYGEEGYIKFGQLLQETWRPIP